MSLECHLQSQFKIWHYNRPGQFVTQIRFQGFAFRIGPFIIAHKTKIRSELVPEGYSISVLSGSYIRIKGKNGG